MEKLNVQAVFEATERGEKLNHACANVNWLCTAQRCGTERQGRRKGKNRGGGGGGGGKGVRQLSRAELCLCGLHEPPEFGFQI